MMDETGGGLMRSILAKLSKHHHEMRKSVVPLVCHALLSWAVEA